MPKNKDYQKQVNEYLKKEDYVDIFLINWVKERGKLKKKWEKKRKKRGRK